MADRLAAHERITEAVDRHEGDALLIDMRTDVPITRCQSHYSPNVQCTKPPHALDDPWHVNGAVEWTNEAEIPPPSGQVFRVEGEI